MKKLKNGSRTFSITSIPISRTSSNKDKEKKTMEKEELHQKTNLTTEVTMYNLL
jgi:hypothetical protein